MSFTVEDAMKLPAMRGAKLLGGRAGLKNNVFGVTVFEYKESEELQDRFFQSNEKQLFNRIVLTSFANLSDNIELQCKYLKQLYYCGESALILYYTGIIVKAVSPELIAVADEIGFPLIIMPEGRIDIRYGDLISDISLSIVSESLNYNESIIPEVIGRVSKLPSDKRTIDSVLEILSAKLRVSLILTDSHLNALGETAISSQLAIATTTASNNSQKPSDLASLLTEDNVTHHIKRRKAFLPIPGSYIWYVPILDRGTEPMRLFLIETGNTLNDIIVDMTKQTVQLAVELWSNSHSAILASELVKAILNDEPIRMRRLSEVLNIDIKSIHTSWFIRCTDARDTFTKPMIDSVRTTMSKLDSDILLEPYRTPLGRADDLVMFFRNPLDARLLDTCARTIIHNLHDLGCQHVYLTMLDYKSTTANVRNAFSIWNQTEAIARVVFPSLEIFHESEIELVRQCNEIIKLGEASIASATGCLEAIEERHSSDELLKTITVYYLDACMNMQVASKILKVHKNTIKYRINMVCDALGQPVSNPVTTSRLVTALAIRRLLEHATN